MKQYEISVLEYGTDYKNIMGIYEGETALDAVKAYAKDAGYEAPTDEDTDVYGNGARYEWGHEYTLDDLSITSYFHCLRYCVGHRQFNACPREVETGDYLDFAVFDYKTGSEFFRALMDDDDCVRYDVDFDRYVFYDGAKEYWERVHDDVERSENILKQLANELNADMSKINDKLDEELRGVNDLDTFEAAKRAILEDIYDHWEERKNEYK